MGQDDEVGRGEGRRTQVLGGGEEEHGEHREWEGDGRVLEWLPRQ